MRRKLKLFNNDSNQHYINRPLFMFEIKTTKYAPAVVEPGWIIDWTFESRGWTDVPVKWYDKMLYLTHEENPMTTGVSLNTHNWCQILGYMACDIAHLRDLSIEPIEKSFYFLGKKLFSWKI